MNYLAIDWSAYELSQPEWLWLIPFFIIVNIFLFNSKNKYIHRTHPTSLADVTHKNTLLRHPLINKLYSATTATHFKSAPQIFYTLIFSVLVFSLTQPVHIGEKLPDPPQERDIVFIVDTSVSMILRDYILNGERIDRMSLLKGVLDNFIRELKGERMSIIVFGDQAYTLVPLTSDQHLLRTMLSRVQATMAGRFNAIGDAIALAVKQAIEFNDSKKNTAKRKRILVLLTDADKPTGKIDPVIAAQLAKTKQLPLYTIAIGSSNLAAEESRQGGLLYSPVDLQLIKQLSLITGAKSFQAGDPDALERAIEAISLSETNKQEIKPEYYRENLSHWFLITALILFIAKQITASIPSSLFKTDKRHEQTIK